MKKILFFFLAYTFSYAFSQQKLAKGDNILMPTNLIVGYTVPLQACLKPVNGNCPESWLISNVKNQNSNKLIEIILHSLFTQDNILYKPYSIDYPIYDLFNKKKRMNFSEIKSALGYRDKIIETTDNLGNITSVLEEEFDTVKLFGINFYEEWLVTEKPFSMTKKILGFCPVSMSFGVDDTDFNSPEFKKVFLFLDTITSISDIKQSDKRMILSNKIQYEYYLTQQKNFNYDFPNRPLNYGRIKEQTITENYLVENSNSSYLNENGINNLIGLLINKVVDQNYPAYDYENKKLSAKEVYRNLGGEIANHEIGDETVIIKSKINLNEIKSIFFHEEWFIDPISLRMQKKVIGVSLIRWYYNDSDMGEEESLNQKHVFTIYFEGMN